MIAVVLTLAAGILASIAVRNRETWERNTLLKAAGSSLVLVGIGLGTLPGGFMLQKIMARLVMPTGLLWSALLLGLFVGIATRNRGLTVAAAAFWLGFTLIGSSFVGGALIYSLEADYVSVKPLSSEPFDAVMVLGGGTSKRHGYAQVASSGDRVLLGARLFHAGRTKTLVTSGSSIPGMGGRHDSAQTTTELWTSLKVPEPAIVRVPEPKNTLEEIRALDTLQAEQGWKRVGLVTSAWHMRRATRLASAHGVVVTPLPADFRGDLDYEGVLSFIPDPQGLTQTYRACWEYLGAAFGR